MRRCRRSSAPPARSSIRIWPSDSKNSCTRPPAHEHEPPPIRPGSRVPGPDRPRLVFTRDPGPGTRFGRAGVRITRDEARRIALLAHLAFDDASLDRMAEEMTKILTYIDQLREVEGGGQAILPVVESEGQAILPAVEGGGQAILPVVESGGQAILPAVEGGGQAILPVHSTPLRDDEIRPGIAREKVEANAPAWRDGHFLVPKVIE